MKQKITKAKKSPLTKYCRDQIKRLKGTFDHLDSDENSVQNTHIDCELGAPEDHTNKDSTKDINLAQGKADVSTSSGDSITNPVIPDTPQSLNTEDLNQLQSTYISNFSDNDSSKNWDMYETECDISQDNNDCISQDNDSGM